MLPAVVRAAPGGADPTEYFLTSLHLLVHVGMACKEHRPVPPSPLTPPPPAPLFTEKHNASLHTSGCEQDLVLSHKTAATASAHARRVLALLTSLEPAHAEAANGNGAAKKGGEGAAPPLLERALVQARTAGSGATPPPPATRSQPGQHTHPATRTRAPLSPSSRRRCSAAGMALELRSVVIAPPALSEPPLAGPLSASVPRGAHVFVSGPNGCGKSSLLRVALGVWPAGCARGADRRRAPAE